MPTQMGTGHHMLAQGCPGIQRQAGLGPDEIKPAEGLLYLQEQIDIRTNFIGHSDQDPDDLTPGFIMQLPNLIVHLKKLHRFHKNRMTCSRYIMHHPLNLPLVCLPERDHQPALTNRHPRILIHPSLLTGSRKDLLDAFPHLRLQPPDLPANPVQLFGGIVADLPLFGEDAGDEIRDPGDAMGDGRWTMGDGRWTMRDNFLCPVPCALSNSFLPPATCYLHTRESNQMDFM